MIHENLPKARIFFFFFLNLPSSSISFTFQIFLPPLKSNFFFFFENVLVNGIFMNTFTHESKINSRNLRQVHFISRTVPLLAFGYLFETSSRVTIVVPFYWWDRSRWPLLRLTESPSRRKFHHFSVAFTVHARSFAGVIGDASVTRITRTRVSFRGG